MFYPHVPEQHRELLEEWEAILANESDPRHTCVFCGEPIVNRRRNGPRRLYCTARCRVAAGRARAKDQDQSDWIRGLGHGELFGNEDADGAQYLDAFPGDHPPLNYPVVPREGEPNSEFGWAFEIIGSPV